MIHVHDNGWPSITYKLQYLVRCFFAKPATRQGDYFNSVLSKNNSLTGANCPMGWFYRDQILNIALEIFQHFG